MDANQVGYVTNFGWDEVKEILDNALKIKPRRQMSVQFSGGEPTMSPLFLDAVAYARKIGYNSVQAATNGSNSPKQEFSQVRRVCVRTAIRRASATTPTAIARSAIWFDGQASRH